MAFENIDIISLKQAITSCKNSLNYNTTKKIINTFSDENSSSVQSKLGSSMQKLSETRYKELEEYLDKCIEVSNKIEEYKIFEKQKQDYELKLAKLNEQKLITTDNTVELDIAITQITNNINEIANQMEEIEIKVKNMI